MINLAIGTGAFAAAVFVRHTSLAAPLAAAVVVQAGALWWRRRQPVAVLLVVVGVEIATIFISSEHEPSGVGLAFAVYAASVYGPSRVRLLVAAAAIAVILATVILLVLGDVQASRTLVPAAALSLVAWVIGDYVRSRRAFIAELVASHQKERQQAAEQERLRIARELHDVVAHNVSLMAIQAGAARVSGGSSRQALEVIEQSARVTLAELNTLLGVLRSDPGIPARSPQPALDEVEALLQPARDAGLEATLRLTGDKRPLPAALDLSAYRIIQEAITNVLKHAQASRVEVVLDYTPDSLVLTVRDNGSGSRETLGEATGHGLIGMRERVELFGGELGATSSPLGGFAVRARLPLPGPAIRPEPAP